ncbi:MAG: hypothetical protein HRT89_07535 [Lentisphaeria bacterium]|nr:GDSL-type esterase/lipase family protein [Lentisphaeria bacterium]NQZ67905.1 hypothetical protein [Lentisphaeria bacterium]
MATAIQDGQTILFTGDSITDSGRNQDGIGSGYVNFFKHMLYTRELDKNIKIINTGIGGNNVENLRDRWMDDVVDYKPDWLSIKIGINDCMQAYGGNLPKQEAAGYEEIYDQVIGDTKRHLPSCQILLITPFYGSYEALEGSHRGDIRNSIQDYISATIRLSEKYNTRLLNTSTLFEDAMKRRDHTDFFRVEPVHPSTIGHFLIAENVYRTLEE